MELRDRRKAVEHLRVSLLQFLSNEPITNEDIGIFVSQVEAVIIGQDALTKYQDDTLVELESYYDDLTNEELINLFDDIEIVDEDELDEEELAFIKHLEANYMERENDN